MPIIIKEIQVKTSIVRQQLSEKEKSFELLQMKKELMAEVKEYLHKEYLRKHER